MIHELKTWPHYFHAVRNGHKTFELRKNDRNYQVGDILELHEFDDMDNCYTGLAIRVEVTYILSSAYKFGLREGYVIMGIKPCK